LGNLSFVASRYTGFLGLVSNAILIPRFSLFSVDPPLACFHRSLGCRGDLIGSPGLNALHAQVRIVGIAPPKSSFFLRLEREDRPFLIPPPPFFAQKLFSYLWGLFFNTSTRRSRGNAFLLQFAPKFLSAL